MKSGGSGAEAAPSPDTARSGRGVACPRERASHAPPRSGRPRDRAHVLRVSAWLVVASARPAPAAAPREAAQARLGRRRAREALETQGLPSKAEQARVGEQRLRHEPQGPVPGLQPE